MTAQMPPGWYDDPDGSPNAERRWDGHNWTPERRRKVAQARPPQVDPPPLRPPPPPYPQPAQYPVQYSQPPQAQYSQHDPPPPYPQAAQAEAWYSQHGQLSPYPPSGQPQPTTQAASNVFSIIAFVCAGLALLGGMTLVALPTIFGVVGIICAVVALTKKERLAPYAIGAAVGGLFLGWILQAAVFDAVFS